MSKKILTATMVFLIISVLLTSCAGNAPGFQLGVPAGPGEVLYEDDFSRNRNGWGIMERAGGDIEIKYGGMLFSVDLPNFMFWSITGGNYRDAQVEVDTVLVEGPVDNAVGVICRYQDEDNFYGFMISHDGYYGIFKYLEGSMVMATEDGNLAYSEVIRQGGDINHIKAVCQGNELSLSVNGSLLAAVNDDSFTEGKTGLLAGSYDKPGVIVLFDNFKVVQP